MTPDTENNPPVVAVIIPAYNEADSISKVLADIPYSTVNEVIVVNNNSTDATAKNAVSFGTTVLDEARQGYGAACLRGIQYVQSRLKKPDIIVFMDADFADYPSEMNSLIQPIIEQDADMVIGSRMLGKRERGAMLPQQIAGSWLATILIRLLYGTKFTDLGPFRAIKYHKLIELNMNSPTYGWTVEMQVKAVKHNFKIIEVPVSYRARIGKSKISGTIRGAILAGYAIITTVLRYR